MPQPDEPAEEFGVPAPVMPLFAVLGRKWTPHVLFLLAQRPARFTELQRAIPAISATSLNDRLRDLVDAGLVQRHTSPGPPMGSSYEATAAGLLVGQHLLRMVSDAGPPARDMTVGRTR